MRWTDQHRRRTHIQREHRKRKRMERKNYDKSLERWQRNGFIIVFTYIFRLHWRLVFSCLWIHEWTNEWDSPCTDLNQCAAPTEIHYSFFENSTESTECDSLIARESRHQPKIETAVWAHESHVLIFSWRTTNQMPEERKRFGGGTRGVRRFDFCYHFHRVN